MSFEKVRELNYDHHRRMTENVESFGNARQEEIVRLDDDSMRELLADIPMSPRALELGSASGDQWPVIAEKALSIKGIDLYEPAVLKAQADRKDIVVGFVEDMPFDDESFDLVVSRHVMEHVDSIQGALAEIKRVLRPGGYVAAVTPHYFPDPEPAHLNKLLFSEWQGEYEKAGFEIVRVDVKTFNCEETHITARRPQ